MEITDPTLLASLQSGRDALSSHTATEGRQLEKYLGRYGVVAPEYLASAYGTQKADQTRALENMMARAKEIQIRADLNKRRLDIMEKQYKIQKKNAQRDRKQAMYDSALNAGAMIGGAALGSMGGGGKTATQMTPDPSVGDWRFTRPPGSTFQYQ